MTYILTPTTLLQILLFLAIAGLCAYGLYKKHYKLVLAVLIITVLLVIAAPVRKTVDDKSIQSLDAQTFDRHQTIPDRVLVIKPTFDEVLESEGERIKSDNNETRKENLDQ